MMWSYPKPMNILLTELVVVILSAGWIAITHPQWVKSIGEWLIRLSEAMEAGKQAYKQKPGARKALVPEVITDPLQQDVISALVNLGTAKKKAETAAVSAIGKVSVKDFDSVFVIALQIARAA